jgi:hypothetical protein
MIGLPFEALEAIENLIKTKFDTLSLDFLGIIPLISKEKHMIFTTSRNNIISLYLQALGTRTPNAVEEQTLKKLMTIASGYIDALRDRTTARILNDVDSYVSNSNAKQEIISEESITNIIEEQLGKATGHLKMIVNSESNKASNVGTALQISKIAEEKGIEDPTVFFIVTRDDVTGKEEWILHLLPDRVTPRLWKLSEIGAEYHKVGDPNPKLPGLHPNCRCKLTILMLGWGFDSSGRVKFIGLAHDEFKEQREKYNLPR